MKIMVTGGAGFIGSNVAEGYLREGHEVVVVDNLRTGRRENVSPDATFYETDIRSSAIGDLIKRENPDIINHHAAQISVPASVSDPLLDADINLKGLLCLLENAVAQDVRKFIFISSGGAIYGEAEEYPTSEACPPRPLSPYAVSKYASEHYLAYYHHQHGLDYTTLRYANIYGPRQIPKGEAGVVAIFMDQLIRGRRSTLYHFPEKDSGMVRDYCYVGDVVKANICALERGSTDFFNIGTGIETRTLALYNAIFEGMRSRAEHVPAELAKPERKSARAGDLPQSCLVVEKAYKGLGWRPETALKEGIMKTLEWRLDETRAE